MTDRFTSFNDAGQDDVQGYIIVAAAVAFGVGVGLGYLGATAGDAKDGRDAAWLGQQALNTANAGRAILNGRCPQ